MTRSKALVHLTNTLSASNTHQISQNNFEAGSVIAHKWTRQSVAGFAYSLEYAISLTIITRSGYTGDSGGGGSCDTGSLGKVVWA